MKKGFKSHSNNESEKSNIKGNFFTDLYDHNFTLDINEINKSSSNMMNEPELRSPRRVNCNAIAPINININNPKIMIPQQNPLKKSPKSKLGVEPSPRRTKHQKSYDVPKPPPTPSTTPRISNDHLSLFDETEYDDQKFIQGIISRIESNEPVYAKSLFYHQNGQCDWRKCVVVGYNAPRFIIKFDSESSKTKEVPRVALKFDVDDQKRFENRRNEAYANRNEADAQLRLETYLYSRASRTKGVAIQPEVLQRIIRRIGPFDIQNNLLNNIVQEVNNVYLYSDALGQFVVEWNNPQSAEKFTKNGLERFTFVVKKWSNSPDRLNINNLNLILPNQVLLQEIVNECISLENTNFLVLMFKHMHPPDQLSYFFEQLKFELNGIISDIRENIRNKISNCLIEIVKPLKRSYSEKIQLMVNLRFKEALASLVNSVFLNVFDMLKEYKITFDISVENNLSKQTPSFDTIERFAIESLEIILNIFEVNKIPKIEIFGNELENFSISFNYLNNSFEKAKQQFLDLLNMDKQIYDRNINQILSITKDIPTDPETACKEIFANFELTEDFPLNNIDFDLIGNKLKNAKLCYNQFLLSFTKKIEANICTFDIKQCCQFIINNYNQFYSLIFTKLELISDFQVSKIHDNLTTLDSKSGKSSNSIEEWYEKHCVILEIKNNINQIENKLNFVLKIINFMTDFLYHPQRDYSYVINLKKQLLTVCSNIKKYSELDYNEKIKFTQIHSENICELKNDFEEFRVELMEFHNIDSNESNYPLLIKCKEKYDALIDKMNLFQSRDIKLELQKTEYDIVKSLQTEIDTILTVWTIGHKLETVAENWLSIPFRELDIPNVANTLVEWRSTLEKLSNELDENNSTEIDDSDLIPSTIIRYKDRINRLIQHLPIVTALCNKHFRGRHWDKINAATSMNININEGLTWNWLIECGIEAHMLAIKAISRAADSEFLIESALSEMVEELQTMRLKVNEENGVLRLEDTSYAFLMLGKHQQKLQEIFIPPYVNPFLERIRNYNVLETNLRQILKQTIEAQQKIDELKPAMDSNDIRTQHEEMAAKFDNQIKKFNDFTGSFKLSLSFHQIVGNERYVGISSELLTNFNDIRENLVAILEEKRKICPRFRLLSDSQLVFLISNCDKPSATKKIYSLMYSNVKKILLENENYCIGFVAKSGEVFMFENKIKVTPDAIEKWNLEFDNEIKETMKKMVITVMSQYSTNLERILTKLPIQIVCLVYNILFTTNVNRCFHALESNILPNSKQSNFLDNIQNYLSSLKKEILVIAKIYKKTKIKQISSLIFNLINQRDLLSKIIKNKIRSSEDPLWYSYPKFVITNKNPDDLTIAVKIGPASFDYGFEYTGVQKSIFKSSKFVHLFSNFLLSISNSVVPLICADVEIRKSDVAFDFASMLGFSPFVYPCYSSTTIDKLKSVIKNSHECREFLILEGIDQLTPSTLNELHICTFCEKKRFPIIATYSLCFRDGTKEVPEQFKFYYRPIYLSSVKLEKKYKFILESLLIGDSNESTEYASKRFSYLTQTVSKLFSPPLNTILMENSIIKFFKNHPFISIKELVQLFIIHIKSYLSEYDINEMLEYVFCLFNDLEINFNPSVILDIKEELDTFKTEDFEIKNQSEFDKNLLYTFKSHYGIIVLGNPMTGKSTLIKNVAKEMKKKLLYLNPFSISMEDLYGADKSSGLLSSLLSENGTDQWVVFDGSCKADWIELASYSLLNNNKRMTFGDGSMLDLASSFRIIFETDDISMASPLTLGVCTTIYINNDRITLNDHLNNYIEVLSNENKIIEPLSMLIVGSNTPSSELIDILKSFFEHFIPKISEFIESLKCNLSVSKVSHCIHNFFECFHCYLLNYYVSENKHTSNDLLMDAPNLLFFSLIWSFGGLFNNENRIKISDFLNSIAKQYIQSINSNLTIFNTNESLYLFDYFYDEQLHLWKNWNEKETLLPDSLKVSPKAIFIPNNSLISSYSLIKDLIKQQKNVLLFSENANHITPYVDICLNSHYFLSEMSVLLYNSFYKTEVNDILHSLLPDLTVSNGLSMHHPLLALLGIDITECNRNSELLRFVLEHKFFRNNKTYVNESVPSLRHLLTTDKKELNPRLCHFCFLLNIEKIENQDLESSFASSMENKWKIDRKLSLIISKILIQTFDKIRSDFPQFDLNSLQLVFQRSTTNLNNCDHIVEVVSKEILFTYYESTKSDSILSIINESKLELVNQYNELECNNNNKYSFVPEEKTNVDNDSIESSLEIDIAGVSKLLQTFRTNLIIKCDSKEIPLKIIEGSCNNKGFYLYKKKLEEPLLEIYHDCFIHSGMKKEHSVLFIDNSSIGSSQELEMLNSILQNNNIFGMFKKGEKMKLMSELHKKDASLFDEDAYESEKNFNFLLSDFLCDSEKYCHIVIAVHSENKIKFNNAFVYIPMANSIQDKRILSLKKSFQQNLSHLFENYPYLLSDNYLNSILSRVAARESQIKEKTALIKERLSILKESKDVDDTFLNEYFVKMKNTETDINQLNEELKVSMQDLQQLQEISEQQAISFEKEAEALKVEELKVQNLRKECEAQLEETKKILEASSNEVKNLSLRDMAVIKTMIHPPKGVVLVVIAMCIVMDVDIKYNKENDDYSSAWAKGKSVMNDPSFLNKLLTSALDLLNPLIIQKLEPIVNDPNFEPSIIEKSSSAAKSICIFIRSLIPYYEALNIYKEKNSMMNEMQDKLQNLFEKQNEAMQKLSLSKNKCIENQIKIDKLTKTKKSYEDQLNDQREKNSFYRKFQESIELYTNEKFEFFSNKIEKNENIEELLFIKEVFRDLSGPFTDSQRNEILECLNNHFNKKLTRKDLLFCDNDVVKKWHKLQYPISQFWKENTSFMSPEGGRWVVVEGLRCCSSSFLKKLLNSPNLPTLSVLSSTFESELLELIQKSNIVILTDYDFNHPSLIVSLIYRSIENKENTFCYQSKTIKIQNDLIIYFDVDLLPSVSYIDFNAVLINLRIGSPISAEQIAHSMYKFKPEFSEIQRNESSIRSNKDKIAEIEKSIETLLCNNRIEIFISKELQNDFIKQNKERNDLIKSLTELDEIHLTLFDSFSDTLKIASDICQYFEKFPIQTSIWRLYENYFESVASIESVEAIKSQLTTVILASLPSKMRISTILNANSITPVDFDKDIENFASVVGSYDMLKLQNPQNIIKETSPSRPVFVVSPSSQFQICSLVNYLRNDYCDETKSCSCIIYNHSDDISTFVQNSIKTGSVAVVLLNSIDDFKNAISSISIVLSQSVFNKSFRLFLIVNFKLNKEDDIWKNKINVPSIISFCDTFYYAKPINAYSIFTELNPSKSSYKKLAAFHSISSIINKFTLFGQICEFSSYFLAMKCLDSVYYNEELAEKAEAKNICGIELFISLFIYGNGKFSSLKGKANVENMWNYHPKITASLDLPSDFGMSEHEFDYYKDRFYIYIKRKFKEKNDEQSEETNDDPSIVNENVDQESACFGEQLENNENNLSDEDEVFNHFKSFMSIDLSALTEVPRIVSHEFSFIQENLRQISEGTSHFTSLFQRQLMQIINLPRIYDISLFVSPNSFFEIIKAEFMKRNGYYSETVILIEDPCKYEEESQGCGSLCKGIVALNAKFSEGKFEHYDGFTILEEFWIKPIYYDQLNQKGNNVKLRSVPFYKDGQEVDSLYIRFEGEYEELEKIVFLNN